MVIDNKNIKSKTNSNKQIWITELNYLRAFAILAVIMIHTTMYFTEINKFNNLMISLIIVNVSSHFAVPVFIIISGIVLTLSYSDKIDIKDFYRRRLFFLIPSYLIISIFYYLINCYIFQTKTFSFLELLYRILAGKGEFHLYFIIIILQFYILFPFLLKMFNWFKRKNKLTILIIIAIIIQFSYRIGLYYYVGSFGDTIIAKGINRFLLSFLLVFFMYFIIGMVIANYMKDWLDGLKKIKIIPLIGIALFFVIVISAITSYEIMQNETNTSLGFIPYTFIGIIEPFLFISTFILLWKIGIVIKNRKSDYSENVLGKALDKFGDLSYGMYLIHFLFLNILIILLMKISVNFENPFFYLIAFSGTVILSYFAVSFISKLPYNWILIGPQRKKQKLGRIRT